MLWLKRLDALAFTVVAVVAALLIVVAISEFSQR